MNQAMDEDERMAWELFPDIPASEAVSTQRERFEKWITSPPFEKRIARFADDAEKAAWPGSYRQIEVELAWQAWQEAARQSAGKS
jgi:hypothetical protein